MTATQVHTVDRADRLAARLSVPVLVAALASIPATYLTLADGVYATAGTALNTFSGIVLVAETVVLFAVAGDRRAWLHRNRWLVGLTVAIIPAVVFAIGPLQLLRMLRFVRVLGALRILRVRRIIKAGRIIRQRYGLTGRWERIATGSLTAATALFVAIVLADPSSESRQLLDSAAGRVGVLGILVAGALLAAATFVVWGARKR